jgi:phenylalanyl-tRNA synthetase beta subunit
MHAGITAQKDSKMSTKKPVGEPDVAPTLPDLKNELAKFKHEVEEVAKLGLRSTAAQIRVLTPSIDHLSDLDFSHEKICEILNAAGIEVKVSAFRSTLGRERMKSRDDA